eukprot:1144545-Pelagomonas_calceolata.AAC.3
MSGYTILHHQKKLCLPYERRSSKNISALASVCKQSPGSALACRIFITSCTLLCQHHPCLHHQLHVVKPSSFRDCISCTHTVMRPSTDCFTQTHVPVQEGLASEHGSELLRHALEHLLDGCGVAHKGSRHLQALGGDVAHAGLHVVGDPLHEVGAVLVLHVEHLLVNLLGGHAAAELQRQMEKKMYISISR